MAFNRVLYLLQNFSKYYDPAQNSSDQKDLIISQLKAELFELRQKEKDYYQIKSTLSNLESRYQLLQDEKQRSEYDQESRLESNQRIIEQLKQDQTNSEKIIDEISINIQELAKDNLLSKQEVENKQQSIYQTRNQLNEVIDASRKANNEIQQLETKIQKISLEKQQLIDEANMSQRQDSNLKQTFSILEKNLEGCKESKAQLEKELDQINQNNKEINEILQQKNEELKTETDNFVTIQEEIQKIEQNIQKIEQQIHSSKIDSNRNANQYQNQVLRNQDLNNKISLTQGQINSRQNQLASETKESSDHNQENFELKEDNKTFNEEIQKHMTVVQEQQNINKNFIISTEQHIEEDDAARRLLARRERMKTFLLSNQTSLKQSQMTIMNISPKNSQYNK